MTDLRRFHAVVFDCDGTLLDSEALAVHCEQRLLAAHGYEVTDADIETCVGTSQQATYAHYLAKVPGLPPPAAFWKAFDALFYEEAPAALAAFPDAVAAVELLAERGVPMAVASSTPAERLRWQLDLGGLAHYFEAVVGGDEVACGKPAPDGYLAAAARLRAEPAACLAVEDTHWGAQAAGAAGMRVIAVDRTGQSGGLPADVRVADLAGPEAMAEWERLWA